MLSYVASKEDALILFTLTLVIGFGLLFLSTKLREFISYCFSRVRQAAFYLGLQFAAFAAVRLFRVQDQNVRPQMNGRRIFLFALLNITVPLMVVPAILLVFSIPPALVCLIAFLIIAAINLALIISALAVLYEDNKMINGLSNRSAEELNKERTLTDGGFLICASILLCLSLSGALWSLDSYWPRAILARPVGTSLEPLGYIIATLKYLPFGEIFLTITGISQAVVPEGWLGKLVGSAIYGLGNLLLIGTVAFLLQQRSEARSLTSRLVQATDGEYGYLIERAKRTPSYFRGYLVNKIAEEPNQVPFERALKVVCDLEVRTGAQTLLYNLCDWKGNVVPEQVALLEKHVRAGQPHKTPRIPSQIAQAACIRIKDYHDDDLMKMALIPFIFWGMAALVRNHEEAEIEVVRRWSWGLSSARKQVLEYLEITKDELEQKLVVFVARELPIFRFPGTFLYKLCDFSIPIQECGIEAATDIVKRYDPARVDSLPNVVRAVNYHFHNSKHILSPEMFAKLSLLRSAAETYQTQAMNKRAHDIWEAFDS